MAGYRSATEAVRCAPGVGEGQVTLGLLLFARAGAFLVGLAAAGRPRCVTPAAGARAVFRFAFVDVRFFAAVLLPVELILAMWQFCHTS